MKSFVTKTFTIPALKGISGKSIEEHLKLYAGYVKNANLILEKIAELKQDAEKNAYALGEINRRFGFEFNGMRNHEVYFASLEGGAKPMEDKGHLKKMIAETWGSFESWLAEFKAIALTRGIGWAMLYFDRKDGRLLDAWIDEQHLGQLQDCALILGLDMWEHSYVADYQPSGKKNYIEDFFANLNWTVIEDNFLRASQPAAKAA
ncbi:MAG: superoxide dismutase, Fe-Mn family [Candidatus Parcubacteria bacterium]|jgi:Fe-Mn family superoxide dismutase|nr:superoxide dismutase, Fe-Mn family [Candidatus Parcubacteria bacterium]